MALRQSDPLKITLTRPVRVGIMFFLITAFFVISPIIILYTGGWRWNFSTGELEATGVLSVDTEPDDAEVFLNDRLIAHKQPLRLSSLAPGNYRVKISKPGYHSFSTDIVVRSHETTYIRNTTLFATNKPQFVTSTDGEISHLKINQFNPLAFQFVTMGSSTELIAINSSASKKFLLKSKDSITCAQTKNYCAIWKLNSTGLTLVDSLGLSEEKTLSLPASTQLAWNEEKRGPLLYAEEKKSILNINSNFSTSNVGAVSSTMWFVDNGQKIWTYTTNTLRSGTGNDQVAIIGPREVEKIITVRGNYALLKTRGGLSIMNAIYSNPEISNLDDYENFEYHVPTAEWRLWSKWEISSLYDHSGAKAILYRSAEPIQFVKALEPAGVLLIVQNNKLIAFNPGYYASQELATFTAVTDLATDEENRLILIAGSLEGQNGIFSLAY